MSAEPAHSMSALTEQLTRLPGIRTASELFAGCPPHPVDAPLAPLFRRGGLPRGEIVAVTGEHAFSLALAACAAATREQLWCAALGMGEPAVAGVADLGIDLAHFVSLRTPAQDWLRVTSILVESFDILIVRPGFDASPGERQRLLAKVRERRMTLITLEDVPGAGERLRVGGLRWEGTDHGSGRLEQCTITVRAARTGTHTLLLPAASGRAERPAPARGPAMGPAAVVLPADAGPPEPRIRSVE
ncbi:porin [Brevibacterium ihuae]|uniref:porin n=1 Tax=Brevibacterium ihuae TaxID=1631743 RepID=UPI000C75E505|nr:porin [Brevibacterium ihuae]